MKKTVYAILLLLFFVQDMNIYAQNLINSQYVGSRSKNYLQGLYGPLIQNGVDLYRITYETPDIHGDLDTASGLLVLPVRQESFTYPLLCYQHGTVNGPNDVPSHLAGGSQLPMVFGGMGYVTSAADYLGLGEARGFHPYVHAKSEASAAIDMLFAVREFAENNDELYLNDQLFISGYSQGGHAAAAVHREIEEFYQDDFTVTASAPMSGPYNISETFTGQVLDESVYYYPGYIAYAILSFNLTSDLGYEISDLFKPSYVPSITQFYNREIELSTLHADLISLLTFHEGASIPKFMVQDSIINYVTNFPDHPINESFRANDVFDWTPLAPTRLFYCTADDQVLYVNSEVADSVMNANGALDVAAVDVEPTADHGGCVNPAMVQTLLFFGAYQELTVSTANIPFSEEITIAPNPVGNITRLINVPENSTIEVFDIKGSIILQQKSTSLSPEMDLADIEKGIYFIRVTKGSNVFHGKIVKE